ncbi:hypothetical protein ACLOJK_019724 [Asimina triloba]
MFPFSSLLPSSAPSSFPPSPSTVFHRPQLCRSLVLPSLSLHRPSLSSALSQPPSPLPLPPLSVALPPQHHSSLVLLSLFLRRLPQHHHNLVLPSLFISDLPQLPLVSNLHCLLPPSPLPPPTVSSCRISLFILIFFLVLHLLS